MEGSTGFEPAPSGLQPPILPLDYVRIWAGRRGLNPQLVSHNHVCSRYTTSCIWRTQKDSSLYLRITKAVSLPLDDRCIGPRIFYGERGTRAAIFVDLANLTSIFRVGCEFGASREFRNPDLLYTKQVLFPLSYTSI